MKILAVALGIFTACRLGGIADPLDVFSPRVTSFMQSADSVSIRLIDYSDPQGEILVSKPRKLDDKERAALLVILREPTNFMSGEQTAEEKLQQMLAYAHGAPLPETPRVSLSLHWVKGDELLVFSLDGATLRGRFTSSDKRSGDEIEGVFSKKGAELIAQWRKDHPPLPVGPMSK